VKLWNSGFPNSKRLVAFAISGKAKSVKKRLVHTAVRYTRLPIMGNLPELERTVTNPLVLPFFWREGDAKVKGA
jgi:hypothetical protein